MRIRRTVVVAAAVVAGGLFLVTPAQAGNWEETLLDPTPARIEAGVTYTFGYWILQHGSYPYRGGDGALGPTALRATDERGEVVDFAGTETPTAGHYSAEVVFPHDGAWLISSRHGVLMPDEDVATVTVPGAVKISPSMVSGRPHHDWGVVRPSFPPTAPGANRVPGTPVASRDVVPRGHGTAVPAAGSEAGSELPVWLVFAGGTATVGLAFVLARRHRRPAR